MGADVSKDAKTAKDPQGLGSLRTTSLFRVVNFELFAKQVTLNDHTLTDHLHSLPLVSGPFALITHSPWVHSANILPGFVRRKSGSVRPDNCKVF